MQVNENMKALSEWFEHIVLHYNKVGSLPHKTDDSNCAMGQK